MTDKTGASQPPIVAMLGACVGGTYTFMLDKLFTESPDVVVEFTESTEAVVEFTESTDVVVEFTESTEIVLGG
jgi:hypothetical protein